MRIADLNIEWLSSVLHLGQGRVRNLRWEPLGTGQVADTYRLQFELDDAESRSLVLKLTSLDAASSEIGRKQSNYLREVRYYQTLAQTLEVRVPGCWHAEIDGNGVDFSLLLEDLSPCTPGNQLAGCTLDEAYLVLGEAAKLHAPRWADPTLGDLTWLTSARPVTPKVASRLAEMFIAFRERYAPMVEEEILEVGDTFFRRLREYFALLQDSPWTVQHGDFRPDNVLFDAAGGDVPVAVVDWQTVSRGPGVVDLSYFIGGALATELRRQHERDLVAHYHHSLCVRGVTDYSFDDCWRDYARFSFQGYFVGVGAAMGVKRTERGDRALVSMVRHAGQQIIDLQALSHL